MYTHYHNRREEKKWWNKGESVVVTSRQRKGKWEWRPFEKRRFRIFLSSSLILPLDQTVITVGLFSGTSRSTERRNARAPLIYLLSNTHEPPARPSYSEYFNCLDKMRPRPLCVRIAPRIGKTWFRVILERVDLSPPTRLVDIPSPRCTFFFFEKRWTVKRDKILWTRFDFLIM